MTTAADVKRVTRLVREREPRLILVKRTLILPPAGHYLRAFDLASLSHKDRFRMHYFVQPLYRPTSGISVGYGDYLHDDYGPWSASDPRIEERIADALLGDGMARIGSGMSTGPRPFSNTPRLSRTGGLVEIGTRSSLTCSSDISTGHLT